MLTQLGFFLTSAALPLYLRDLGTPQNRIGLDVGLGNAVAVGVSLLLGPVLNRYGAHIFLIAAGTTYLISALGMLALPNESAVAAMRILQGMGNAMMLPSSYVLTAQLAPRRIATALGTMGAVSNLALAVGPPIGLALYVSRGAPGLLLPAAGVACIGLVACILLPRRPRIGERAGGFGFDRAWIPALLTNTLSVVYWGGIIAYLPLAMRAEHGPNAGIFFTADAVGVLLLRIPTGLLADRGGTLLPKLLGLLITLPGILALLLHPSLLTLSFAGFCTGAGAGLFITGILAELSGLSTGANRGTAMSLASSTFSGGVFLGSLTAGLLIGSGGFSAILWLGFAATAASLPLALIRPRK